MEQRSETPLPEDRPDLGFKELRQILQILEKTPHKTGLRVVKTLVQLLEIKD